MRITWLLTLLLTFSVGAIFPSAFARTPRDPLIEEANAAQAAGNYTAAEAIYRRAIEINPNNPYAYNGLGSALSAQEKLEEAIAAYQQAIKLAPNFVIAYDGLGITLSRQGKLEEAIAAFEQALKIDPYDGYVYTNLGFTLHKQGKLEEAIAAFQQGIQLVPKNAYAYNGLGAVLFDQGKVEEAIAAFQQAIQIQPNARHYSNLCNVLENRGDLDQAETACRQAIQLDPQDAYAYGNLGNVLSAQGKQEEAETAYKQALDLPEKKFGMPSTAHTLAHNDLGRLLQQQGRLEEAIAEFDQAVAIDLKFVYPYNNLEETKRQLKIKLDPLAEAIDDRQWLPKNESSVAIFRSVVLVTTKFSSPKRQGIERGTGLIIQRQNNSLLIVTNRHIIFEKEFGQQGQDIQVEFYSQPPEGKVRMRRNAKLLAMTNDEDNIDLAVLEVDSSTPLPEDIQPLPFATEAVVRGMKVRIIGHPVRSIPWFPETVEINSYNNQRFQITNADNISAGYSGSPVINSQNQVVGILVETNGKRAFAYPIPIITAKLRTLGITNK